MVTFVNRADKGTAEENGRIVSAWHEDCVARLLSASSFDVKKAPHIQGQTPDIIALHPNGTEVVVEGVARMKDEESVRAERELHEKGYTSGPPGTESKVGDDIYPLYQRTVEKATKYKELTSDLAFIIAIYNSNFWEFGDHHLFQIAFSAHALFVTFMHSQSDDGQKVVDRGYRDQWSKEQREGIFHRFTRVSGLLYTRFTGDQHLYCPNPYAEVPLRTEMLPFAAVPKPPLIGGKPAWDERDATIHVEVPTPPVQTA